MVADTPSPHAFRLEGPPRFGFTQSATEQRLRDSLLLASAFTGLPTALFLRNEAGVWYRDSDGLTADQLASLESSLTPNSSQSVCPCPLQAPGLGVVLALPLTDMHFRNAGTLCVLSSDPLVLSPAQMDGLTVLTEQVQSLITKDLMQTERRAVPRAPAAASFVPGLVHELRNFHFGITASLDALEARFEDLAEIGRYSRTLRKGVERLETFLDELSEYANPRQSSWSEGLLEPLLREIQGALKPLALERRVDVRLHFGSALPPIRMDPKGLGTAFIRLIGMLLREVEAGGCVDLHVARGKRGTGVAVFGHLEGAAPGFKGLDLVRLFEPFYFRAAGLGRLALPGARRIFECHGGNLMAAPGQEGGVRIIFWLPGLSEYPLRQMSPS